MEVGWTVNSDPVRPNGSFVVVGSRVSGALGSRVSGVLADSRAGPSRKETRELQEIEQDSIEP